MPPKIEELPDDAADASDDEPPPLEDMSDSIRFKQRFTAKPKKEDVADPVKAKAAAAAAAAAAATGQFTKGTVVELTELSNAKFNGKQGTVVGYIPEAGRHMVKLVDGKTIKVRPVNLTRLESFSGFGKGFLASKHSPDHQSDNIEFVKPKNPEEKKGVFSEVQDAMKNAAPFLEQNKDKWCTPALMDKLAKNPKMLQMMKNPQFAAALTEFQNNPAAATAKYGDNPKVSEFFRQFCGIMGEHLTEVGEIEDSKKQQATNSKTVAPAISPQDERALQHALSKPEVKDALSDPKIMKMIEDLKLRPEMAPQITGEVMRNPDQMKKVQVLIQAGLLGTSR